MTNNDVLKPFRGKPADAAVCEAEPCWMCGKMEIIEEYKDNEGNVIGVTASCPDNHYARFLKAPKGVWAAIG